MPSSRRGKECLQVELVEGHYQVPQTHIAQHIDICVHIDMSRNLDR